MYIIFLQNLVERLSNFMKKSSYTYDELINCGNGGLFGFGNAKFRDHQKELLIVVKNINRNIIKFDLKYIFLVIIKN